MQYFKYIWTVLFNVIVLLIVLAIFNSTYIQFERIVFAMLIGIYVTLTHFASTWGKATAEIALAHGGEFQKIAEILGKDVSIDKEILEETRDSLKPVMIKYWINAGFSSIISLIAIYNLIIAL